MSNDSTKTSDTVEKGFFRASAADFKKIPGSPISYWVSPNALKPIEQYPPLEFLTISDGQNITANNDKYLRNHWEISSSKIGIKDKWVFYAKGGDFKKWWGNLDFVVDWSDSARIFYRGNSSARIIPEYLWFKSGITWTLLSSGKTGLRNLPNFATFDKTGSSVFFKNDAELLPCLALLNSKVSEFYLNIFSSSIAYQITEVRTIPVAHYVFSDHIKLNADKLVCCSKVDWNSYETAHDFTRLPLLNAQLNNIELHDQTTTPTYPLPLSIKQVYTRLRAHWQELTLETQRLEEENNRIFIDAYGLQDELTSNVSLKEITLTCNPYYRYGKEPRIDTKEHEKNPTDIRVNSCPLVVQKSFPKDTELEERLLADTLKEFISYAVGCMFGRYALDKSGLILANQGETIADYYKKLQEPRIDTNKHEKNQTNISVNSCSFVVQSPEKEEPRIDTNKHELQNNPLNISVDSCSFVVQSPEKEEPQIDTNAHESQNNPLNISVNSCSFVVQSPEKEEPQIDTNAHESQKNRLNISVNSCSFVVQNPEKEKQEPQKKLLNISVDSCSFVVQKSDILFPADDDNVIPMLDGDWFTDDVTKRFGQFLKITFGDAHYEENLTYIEKALGKDIRKYFLKDFYTDHLKRYKKRPIYWLFSSPKGTFNALIYMHRYRPDTVSVVLNDYLREFRTKLSAHKNHLEAVSISSNASAGEKTKALKDIENHRKMIDELDVYEREVLYPLATEQKEIDLDDGVKVNYQKFGEALKKIPGLAAKEG